MKPMNMSTFITGTFCLAVPIYIPSFGLALACKSLLAKELVLCYFSTVKDQSLSAPPKENGREGE